MFKGSGKVEDATRNYYAVDASIHAVIEDLIRGADVAAVPPDTYTPPTVDLGDILASLSIDVLETQTLSTVKPINYLVADDPTLIQGFNPQGGGLDLSEEDGSYYKVSNSGTPPVVIWEATSEEIKFPNVSFGEMRIITLSSKSSTKVEVFVFNPNDTGHTDGGYNPIPDITFILELANTEQTISVFLSDADVVYLNSLSTKILKIKVKATRSGGFRLDTDQLVFAMAGVVTTDQRDVSGSPVINSGTLMSGSEEDLKRDDTSYYAISSSGTVVEYEATSDIFVFSGLNDVSIPFVIRSSKDDVNIEMYIFNPTDPAHTDGGYDTNLGLAAIIPLKNTDRRVTLEVPEEDISYLNTLSPISLKLKIRATHTAALQLESDQLIFIATSNSSPTQVVRQITQQYIDPGLRNPAMSQMASQEGYLLRIYNVHPGLLNINWASHTRDFKNAKTTVQVFLGLVIDNGVVLPPGKITSKPKTQDNELVIAKSSNPKEAFLRTGFVNVDSGLYTVVFFNDSPSTAISEPFAATGEEDDTWIYVPAYKDYLVESTAGDVGIRAVVRQIPGPTEPAAFPWSNSNIGWIENLVTIQSWEPYGVPKDEQDDDEDGIQNKIDGRFVDSSFADDSDRYSNNFTDQHLAGTSFGSITNRGGLTVTVKDARDPAEGCFINASGTGGGTAEVNACNNALFFDDGDSATVTCSSITIVVAMGPIEIFPADDVMISVPSTGIAKVKRSGNRKFEIEGHDSNIDSITIRVGSNVVVEITRDSSTIIEEIANSLFDIKNAEKSRRSIKVNNGQAESDLNPGQNIAVTVDSSEIPWTPTPAPTATPTPTPVPTATATSVTTATATSVPTATPTPVPTATPTLAPTATPTPAPLPIDNFESQTLVSGIGWLGVWSTAGTVSVNGMNSPYSGSFHMQINEGSEAKRAADLSGRSNLKLRFYGKVSELKGNTKAYAEVSSNGIAWNTVRIWDKNDVEGVYTLEDVDLSAYAMTSQFWIRFRVGSGGGSPTMWVDYVQITR